MQTISFIIFQYFLFDVLPNFPFTTCETMCDYYLHTWYTELPLRYSTRKPELAPEILWATVDPTLYRPGYGAPPTTLSQLFGGPLPQLFGGPIFLASVTFNKVCRALVARLYNRYVKLPRTDKEWEAELKGLLENYEFPCEGVWDSFHVYVGSKLKSYFSFKKRYSMSNLRLVSYNKKFLYWAVGALGSTHDARMLRNSTI